jgi:aspartate carbamoyltransferase catalytic subunit
LRALPTQHPHLPRLTVIPLDPPSPSANDATLVAKKSLLAASDLTRADVESILERAEQLRTGASPRRRDAVVGLYFFQPSVRTRFGFRVAAARIGATAVDCPDPYRRPEMSDAESAEDIIRATAAYCDAIVLRHERARVLDCAVAERPPIVNAGNGYREHPSQALIDLFSIQRLRGSLLGVRIALVGDLRCSRSAHSLLRLLSLCEPDEVRLCCPPCRKPDPEWLSPSLPISWASNRIDLSGIEIAYIAGFPPICENRRTEDGDRARFTLSPRSLALAPPDLSILCPLPRIDEISSDIDASQQARYFQQSREAIFVRTALLEKIVT